MKAFKKLRIYKNKNYILYEIDKYGCIKTHYGCIGGGVVRDIIGKAVCVAKDGNEYYFDGYNRFFTIEECKDINVYPSVW